MTLRSKIPIRKLTKPITAVVTIVFIYGIMAFMTHPNTTTTFYEKNRMQLLEVQHQRNEVIKSGMQSTSGVRLENITRVSSKFKNKTLNLNNRLLMLDNERFWGTVSDLVSGDELYPEGLDVNMVLRRMATSKIVQVLPGPGGTSFKWVIVLEGGQRAVFKPQLVTPGSDEKVYCNTGHEQPRYELAGFHLMRLFGWRNVPFAAGRKLDIVNEILPVAHNKVRETFKETDSGRVCLVHKCLYCDAPREFCFPNNTLEGVLLFWLKYPVHYQFGAKSDPYNLFHPLSSNHTFHKYGLNDRRHCDFVRSRPLYNDTRYFLDLVDIAITSHVMSNEDEKHNYIGTEPKKPIMTIHIDYGLAFCDIKHPAELWLAVIKQCCRVRQKTISGLSSALPNLKADFKSMGSQDVLYPFLSTTQLDEVISRISDVFKMLSQCQKVVPDSVLYDSVH